MSQPTTRQWAEWVKEAADNGWTPARLTVPLLRNLQAKLEALADAEDARPEQPEAMELDLTQFDREALRELRPGQLQSMLHEFMPVTRSEFEALVSRVDKIQRTYHP